MARLIFLVALIAYCVTSSNAIDCSPKKFNQESFVCVCNATFCDNLPTPPRPLQGSYNLFTSTRDELRLSYTTGQTENVADSAANATIRIDTDSLFQTMIGFGGAFTDSTGVNINDLSPAAQENLLQSYFGSAGIGYSVCRIPIAGSDCSTRPYSYDDVPGDITLDNWALTYEDYDYKFPHIKRAIELSSREILFFGSPWAPPAWMKTNGMFNGSGELLPEMWQPYSEYLVKFVEAYEAEGVPIWGLTPQNEPMSGFEDWGWNTCGWSNVDMRDWIKTNLGPTLEAAGMRRLKMMINDFNRGQLPDYVEPSLADADASYYIDGVAVHWYDDKYIGPEVLNTTHNLDPTKFMLYTEGCAGWDVADDESVKLGSWDRGEDYFHDIIEDINHWSTGWVDWNMALDTQGAPNWAGNLLDAPIIINKANDEFYKQPTFYAMAHASKFIERDSTRVATYVDLDGVEAASVVDDGGVTTVLIMNRLEDSVDVSIYVGMGASFVNLNLPAKSFQSLVVNVA